MTKALLAVAALSAALAALIGCGGTGRQDDPTSSSAARDQIAAFTECLRDHGIDVTDPALGDDRITINRDGSTDAQLRAAQKACREYSSGVPVADPPEADDTAEYAQCLREHGVRLADPQPGEPLRIETGQDEQTLEQAELACQDAGAAPPREPIRPSAG